MTLLVGADPEVFFEGPNGPMSIVGKLGGTKTKPKPIGFGCAVQEDNVAAEFNIPPAASAKHFLQTIQYNLDYLEARAKDIGAKLAITPSMVFPNEELQSKEAKTFGCEPDYDAWKMDVNPRPRARDKNLRSCGGHIHLGSHEDPIQLIRACDLFIGAQLVKVDNDTRRRLLYGKAGAFRPKPYGVEYRTPSNVWIKTSKLIRWVFEQCQKVEEFVKKGNELNENSKMGQMIQDCINNSDQTLLAEINKHYGLQAIN